MNYIHLFLVTWWVLLSHSKKFLALIPRLIGPGSFCVKFACYLINVLYQKHAAKVIENTENICFRVTEPSTNQCTRVWGPSLGK